MPVYKNSLEPSGAYRLDADDLKAISQAIAAFLQAEVTINFDFRDGHRLNTASMDEALADQLVRTHLISDIGIKGHNFKTDPRRHAYFHARGETMLTTLDFEIEGPRDECTLLRNQLEDLIKAKKAWWSMLYPKSSLGNGLLAAVAFIIVAAITLWTVHKQGGTGDDLSKMSGALAWWTIPAVFVIGWVRKQIFPRLIIDIGRSASVGVRAGYFRNILFVSVLLALAVRGLGSFAGSLFSN